ncbi:Asp23/Gls24 family envelope stress response protein [Symbiobacterium thermophilum]|uniref:Asp23/Gls24 family envelope stress response protein n=1 Tax=Symbiobacterium thermophilum TaxID=2734 RepID=UPI0035C7852E
MSPDKEPMKEGKEGEQQVESSIRIADDVVGVIAGIAALEVDGVAGMSGGLAAEVGERMTGKKNPSKGVKVQIGEKEVAIDLYIVVEFGVRIPEVATKVQEAVKRAVESMTGLECVEINIHVQGVSFKEPEDDYRVR